MGHDVEIMSSAKFYGNMELEIGNSVFIGHDALIFGAGGSRIVIGDYAKIGSRCVLVTGYHRITPDGPCIRGEGLFGDIIVEEGAAMSTMSMINPGKRVGKMSYVMAGSMVTHDVPDYTQVAGIPAREVKKFK